MTKKTSQRAVNFIIQEITNQTGICPIGGISAIEIAEKVDRIFIIHEVT